MSDRPLSGRPLPSSFDENEEFYNENGFQKVLRRLKEEPLVPLGCILTVAAFSSAYRAMRRGDHHRVQRMFRARVAAQGFTVLAMVAGGMYYAEDRNKQKEIYKKKQQQEAEEKRERWIKELEARDEEEKALQELVNKRRKRAAERAAAGTGTEGVAAQARTALREAKAAGERMADEEATESSGKPAAGEKPSSGSVLGSLGGWFGASAKAPGNSAKAPDSQKPDAEGGRS